LIELIQTSGYHARRGADLGSGTGIIGIYVLVEKLVERMVFIDVNPHAARNVVYNLSLNNLYGRGIVMITDICHRVPFLERSFDVVYANPPYLPGVPRDAYEASLLGGPRGFEAVLGFIEAASRILVDNGRLFLVYSSLSNPPVIESYMSKKCFRIVNRVVKHVFFEDIIAVEAVRDAC